MDPLVGRRAPLVVAAAVLGTAVVLMRRLMRHTTGRHEPGGVLMTDAARYDRHSGWLMGSLFRGIAADVAASARDGARILEVGAGPGHLSVRLARDHDLDVVGLDLDPAMVERANANAEHTRAGARRPTFVVGDVAALPFEDASFDLVVSTFSMHHWSDRTAGLDEIARVLRPDGRAVIWDLRAGLPLFHMHAPDPMMAVGGSRMAVVRATSWRWPWRFSLAQRLELVPR